MVIEISENRFDQIFDEVWDCSLCPLNIVGEPCKKGMESCRVSFLDWLEEDN